jgi:1-acyl-sn-glycerol-3-phosphate acyltransferase
MHYFHLLRLILHLFAGMATCAFIFPRLDAEGRKQRIKDWSARLLAICGVRVTVHYAEGAETARHALIVANHLSWLDIFVINSMEPCRFVAKSEIRQWPLIGWLCEKTGTIFILRGKQRDVRRIYEGLVHRLQAGERVAFFPEGKAVIQGQLDNFHANLFEAAIEANVPVQPYALRYLDRNGNLSHAVDFGEPITLWQSVLSILASRDLHAELILLPIMGSEGEHRRTLANGARQHIAQAMRWSACPSKEQGVSVE